MPFDPAADPWGAAMLGTAGLVVLSLLLAVFASARRVAGWLMGLALVGFLGSAMAGTLERIQGAAGKTRVRDGNATTLVDTTGDMASASLVAPRDSALPEVDPDAASPAGEPIGDAPPSEPPPVPTRVFEVPPLPNDPEARDTAVRLILHEAKITIDDADRCIDPESVGSVWARLRAIPPDVYAAKVRIIVRKLEQCRRKVFWVESYAVHYRAVEARDAMDEILTRRIADTTGIRVVNAVYGMDHEQIRIGVSPQIPEAKVRALVDPALERELEGLGFSRVLISYGERSWTHELAPKPERTLVAERLATFGLEAPLSMERPRSPSPGSATP